MQRILTFLDMMDKKRFDMKQFIYLYFFWERMEMNDKHKLYDSFKIRQPLTNNNFYEQIRLFKLEDKFNIDDFGELYNYWQNMTERERVSSYGMFYKTGNKRRTGKKYTQDEIMWHEYEIMEYDVEQRTKEGPKRAMYYYKCRDCGQRFYASYEQTACKICGSINIYAFQGEQVVGRFDFLYQSGFRERINEL